MTARIRPLVLVEDDELQFHPAVTQHLEMVMYDWRREDETFDGAVTLAENAWGEFPAGTHPEEPTIIPIPGHYDTIVDLWTEFLDADADLETHLGVQEGDFCFFALAPGLWDPGLPTKWRTDVAHTWNSIGLSWGSPPGRPSTGGFTLMHTAPGIGTLAGVEEWRKFRDGQPSLPDEATPLQRQRLWNVIATRVVHEWTHMLGLPDDNTSGIYWNDGGINHVPEGTGLSEEHYALVKASALYGEVRPPPNGDTQPPPLPDEPTEPEPGTPPNGDTQPPPPPSSYRISGLIAGSIPFEGTIVPEGE